MIPMRPHPSGNKKRSPIIPTDKQSPIISKISDRLTSPKDGKNSHVHKLLDTYNTD